MIDAHLPLRANVSGRSDLMFPLTIRKSFLSA
jgi:hypothetical protein